MIDKNRLAGIMGSNHSDNQGLSDLSTNFFSSTSSSLAASAAVLKQRSCEYPFLNLSF